MKTNSLLAAVAGLLAAGSAQAAVVTKKLEIVATFHNASTIKSIAEFTFDPNVYGSATLLSFSSDGGRSFDGALIHNTYYSGTKYRRVTIGGNGSAASMFGGTYDFMIGLTPDGDGDFGNPIGFLQYSTPDQDGFSLATSVTVTDLSAVAAAVPEPATWAMMIGGFGLVGGAMRRRRVAVVAA